MRKNRLEKWLQAIHDTQDEEISCSECFDLVSAYVELEVSGKEPAARLPQVKQHLQQCAACHEEYEALRDLRRIEEEGGDLSIDDLSNSIR